ncbi:unnamed protein product [Prorocentrum cordatum]|uniref:Uncharacterized protein n=1 Tax=Prorocentrum cordatum TaxID=2364126 RepID=A0ABN9V1U1_9DINO|nr:unnamed protein product [Polarella glacialis]
MPLRSEMSRNLSSFDTRGGRAAAAEQAPGAPAARGRGPQHAAGAEVLWASVPAEAASRSTILAPQAAPLPARPLRRAAALLARLPPERRRAAIQRMSQGLREALICLMKAEPGAAAAGPAAGRRACRRGGSSRACHGKSGAGDQTARERRATCKVGVIRTAWGPRHFARITIDGIAIASQCTRSYQDAWCFQQRLLRLRSALAEEGRRRRRRGRRLPRRGSRQRPRARGRRSASGERPPPRSPSTTASTPTRPTRWTTRRRTRARTSTCGR